MTTMANSGALSARDRSVSTTLPRVRHLVATPLQLSRRTSVQVLLSLLYALLVVSFPWETVQRTTFNDFEDSVFYFDDMLVTNNVPAAEKFEISTYTEYFTRELLWYDLIRSLTDITGDTRTSLRVLSFFMLFVWALFLLKRVPYGLALLFLFNPAAIDVAMSSIRNGFAWAVVMIGLSLRSRLVKAALFVTAVCFHAATVVLVMLYGLTRLASRVLKPRTLLVAGLAIGVVVGLALTIGSSFVLGTLGDRRTGEEYVKGGGSFVQASMWGILLCLQSMSGPRYIRRNIFVIALLAWYQTMNPFIPWSYRVWGAFLPVVAVSALDLPYRKRRAFLFFYSGYLVLQYLYWTKLFYYWYPR